MKVRGAGAVAFVSEAGALDFDGTTIANTESTAVRTLPGSGRGVSPLRSQR